MTQQIEAVTEYMCDKIIESKDNPRIAVRYAEYLARMLHHAAVEMDRLQFGPGVQRDSKPFLVLSGPEDKPAPLAPIFFAGLIGSWIGAAVVWLWPF